MNTGDSLTLTVSPSGNPPFKYQWKLNNTVLTGATIDTFKIKSLTANDGGIYSCDISNECGNITRQILNLIIGDVGINQLGIRNEELGIRVFPNPVNETSVFNYQLTEKSNVNLTVYD